MFSEFTQAEILAESSFSELEVKPLEAPACCSTAFQNYGSEELSDENLVKTMTLKLLSGRFLW